MKCRPQNRQSGKLCESRGQCPDSGHCRIAFRTLCNAFRPPLNGTGPLNCTGLPESRMTGKPDLIAETRRKNKSISIVARMPAVPLCSCFPLGAFPSPDRPIPPCSFMSLRLKLCLAEDGRRRAGENLRKKRTLFSRVRMSTYRNSFLIAVLFRAWLGCVHHAERAAAVGPDQDHGVLAGGNVAQFALHVLGVLYRLAIDLQNDVSTRDTRVV